MSHPRSPLRLPLRLLFSLLILLATPIGALALHYRLEWPALAGLGLIVGWSLFGLVLLVLAWRRPPLWPILGYLLGVFVLACWWVGLQPSNEREWADDVARMSHGEVVDGRLLMHDVRNFDWRSDQDYDIVWEERGYDLDQLTSVDLFTSYWGMPAIAHILVSFGFADGRHLVFTVEIRKERHESYSEIGGFFKEFELSIVATDERDAVRVRSNVRDEDVYLYRIDMPREAMRELLLSYVEQANRLTREPRFYNTLTANCTTVVFDMLQGIIGGLPLDYRLLLTGYLPEYVWDVGGLQPGFGLEELRQRGRITERARQADAAADFSARIREGVPGWTNGK